jgi:lipopolysaccharide biosynthesis protein
MQKTRTRTAQHGKKQIKEIKSNHQISQIKNNKLIVVLGMHRSGTSCITRSLQVMGVELGDKLEPPLININDKGFWEDIDFVTLNEEILSSIDSHWYDLKSIDSFDIAHLKKQGYFIQAAELLRKKFVGTSLFGFKDPRVAKLLPFWEKVFDHNKLDVSYVFVLRNPLSVVNSLIKRDNMQAEQAYLLWLTHVMASLSVYNFSKTVFVDYDRFMEAPDKELNRIAKEIDLKIDPAALFTYKTEFLDNGLRHTLYELDDLFLDDKCPPIVQEVYKSLLQIASDKIKFDDIELFSDVERWKNEYQRFSCSLVLADKFLKQIIFVSQSVVEREGQIVGLTEVVAEREGQIVGLTQVVAEREGQIVGLTQVVAEREGQIVGLTEVVAEREGQIVGLTEVVAEREGQIVGLTEVVAEREGQIVGLTEVVAEREGQIVGLTEVVAEREGQIVGLTEVVAEREGQIVGLTEVVAEREGQIVGLTEVVAEQEGQIVGLTEVVAEREGLVANLSNSIIEFRGSKSWRATAPLRHVISIVRKTASVISVLPNIFKWGGGFRYTYQKAARVFRNEGITGVKARVAFLQHQASKAPIVSNTLAYTEDILEKTSTFTIDSLIKPSKLLVVPYYIDPKMDCVDVAYSDEVSIAVHLHLYYLDMLCELAAYLNNIPVQYDLYVSVPESCDVKAIQSEIEDKLRKVKNIVVESVPNRGRDIAPLIIQFGKRLARYEIIAHIHSKKSLHKENMAGWCEEILTKLMGPPGSSGGRIAHLINLLQTTTKIVIPEGSNGYIRDISGWADNYVLARNFLEQYTSFLIKDFPVVEFSEGSMFWARTECLIDFLELPLNYCDFPDEPIAPDGTLAHVLERCILIFASKYSGQFIRIHKGDSIADHQHCEEKQKDYSSLIIHNDIKILSYYLPQFHPIPENDLWHGNGFTEWTKVKAANPLFVGHYQQHIPHEDIGYYLLDSPDVLRQQAELMRQSGVFGQVFYHYWFSGKLILEEPAQLLLNNPDIQMPFCFCWANEHWTRRWDGNEDEILLGQNYSAQDAHDFIHYLIPYFKDSRYIQIEDRPVIFIYRPSSISNSQEYLNIWEKECNEVGIKRPYVVSVLTRGTTSPNDFGMDAGVERVLHDWTGGEVDEMKSSLASYMPINGSVLSYNEVANFYAGQTEAKEFTYFRSLVPIWDNTARYGSEAFLLHGSTPQRFQEWMESTIEYTQKTLPSDRRFVVVNAWNEWAEGAHLEPDTRFGYSYLNSVGRALSGISCEEVINLSCTIPAGLKIHIVFPDFILNELENNCELKERFDFCLSKSSIFNNCSVSINTFNLLKGGVIDVRSDSDHADFILEIRQISYFDSTAIEKMLQTSYATGSTVIPNTYSCDASLVSTSINGSVQSNVAFVAPMLIINKATLVSGFKNFRMRTDAHCYLTHQSLPLNIKRRVVTTIIRYHKTAELNELKKALYCLYAMSDCVVKPFIAAQDLSIQQIHALEALLAEFVWVKGHEPHIQLYKSSDGKGDLRSRMLNESLKMVRTRYAAFLDFDDLLMSHAYQWLISRLESTGKAVSFGRVFDTSFDGKSQRLITRSITYEYGYSYEDFLVTNHAPLHSFMMDIEQLDIKRLTYFDDQRYMEDYFLTLQYFTKDNCDWDSLKENFYIGDYIHSLDREHTLAFSNDEDRQKLLENLEYRKCEQMICEMRAISIKRNL